MENRNPDSKNRLSGFLFFCVVYDFSNSLLVVCFSKDVLELEELYSLALNVGEEEVGKA